MRQTPGGAGAGPLQKNALVQNVLVLGGSTLLNLGGFGFHALASRALGVASYGALFTLISLSTLAVLPGAILNPVVSRFSAELAALGDRGRLRRLNADLQRLCGAAGAVYIVSSLALARAGAAYLHVPPWALPVVGFIAAAAFATLVLRGVAQGTQDFLAYALSASAEGVTKVSGLAVLLVLGTGFLGGVAGFLFGGLCGLVVIALRRRHDTASAAAPTRYDWRRITLTSAGAAAVIVGTSSVGTVDVVLVRHFFSAADAGLYSAASLVGRVIFYLVSFVPIVMLPRVTDHFVRGRRTRWALVESLAALAALELCAVAVLQFAGVAPLHALVGRAFDAARPLLVPYGVAMMLLAVTSALGYYGVATHRIRFAVPLVLAVALTLAAIAFFHASLGVVTHELLLGNALMCLAVAATLGTQAKSGGMVHGAQA